MNKFIKKNKKLIIAFLIIDVIFIVLSCIKVKKDVIVPANISTIDNIILVEDESTLKGSINVVSVYSYENISLLSYLFSLINPYADLSDNVEYYNINQKDSYKGGVIQKRISIYNAIIAGYKEAGYDIKSEFIGYYVDTATVYLDKSLAIGDLIISINGVDLTNDITPSKVISETKSKTVEMKIIKNYYDGNREISNITVSSVEINQNGKALYSFGFSAKPLNIPKNTDQCPDFEVLWDNINSIGPSGGLLQSFFVYEKLTGANLSHNLVIAGTGTVDINGNAGLIGGIKQKIITAELSNVDIFFVPVTSPNYLYDPDEVNYWDAMEGYNSLNNPNIKLVPVWNLSCIIDYLKDYQVI